MAGEKSTGALLSGMRPLLNPGDYVFCCVADFKGLEPADILGSFRESEGLTVILERSRAEALGLPFDFIAAWITLTIHSALDAVGSTAAFSTALGQAGISCNVIAAYYHDHVFVGRDDAGQAMDVLQALSQGDVQAAAFSGA